MCMYFSIKVLYLYPSGLHFVGRTRRTTAIFVRGLKFVVIHLQNLRDKSAKCESWLSVQLLGPSMLHRCAHID